MTLQGLYDNSQCSVSTAALISDQHPDAFLVLLMKGSGCQKSGPVSRSPKSYHLVCAGSSHVVEFLRAKNGR
jgi:hypothetical protein